MILDKVIKEQQTKNAGYGRCENFIDGEIEVTNMDALVIVGVTDMRSPCIYIDQSMFIDLLANTGNPDGAFEDISEASVDVINYELKKDDVELEKGDWPESDYEVLVNEKNKEDMKIGKTISRKVNGQKLKVSGYYSDKYDSDMMLVNNNTVKYALVKATSNITVCPEDKVVALAELKAEGVNVKDTYAESSTEYRKQMWASIFSTLVMAGVILMISFIEIFLIIRASFLSRVKEVGVYRAIGVKKIDIYKMFGGEIFAISLLPVFLASC
jgi:ABC-type antimicrobial peptide transport system permease subunit